MDYRYSVLATCILALSAGTVTASHNSLLGVSSDGKLLLVANPDNGTVSVVDAMGRKTLREIAVGKQPESVAWIGSGPRAIATAYRDNAVTIFDAGAGMVSMRIATLAEPYGVVVDRAGRRAWITQEYPGVVSEIDLGSAKVVRQLTVEPFLRGIALAPDEQRLYVTSFYSASASAIDLDRWAVVDRWAPRSPTDNIARQIAVHPTLPQAYVTHLRSRVERAHGAGSIFPYLSVLDLWPEKKDRSRRHPIAMDQFNGVLVTANPWETAISPDGKRSYTIYAGTNDMNACDILNDDFQYIKSIDGGLIPIGSNPRAVAVSPDSQTVYIYHAMEFAVTFYRADRLRRLATVKVCAPPYSEAIRRGKELFNLAEPPMSSRKWISCSSCHPDGDHDGRTWQNPEGLRRTTHFFGMARTYPLHWSADRDEMQDFEHTIRGPLMQGRGLVRGRIERELGPPNAGRSADLDALTAYCNSLEPTLSPHAAGSGKLTAAAERGRDHFMSEKTQCATCHPPPLYTDRKLHDVGTGNDDPSEKMGPKYDTPSLIRAYRNLSFFHHGKAKTLRDVLATYPGDRHGRTSHLSPRDRDDLVEFLKSLPYELPAAGDAR